MVRCRFINDSCLIDVKECLHAMLCAAMYLDLIPLSFSYRIIEDVASAYPDADMIVSEDVSTMINTGCMIFRNTA
jgi:hypothetical protein